MLLGALCLTLIASWQLWRLAAAQDQQHFENSVTAVRSGVRNRLEAYIALVRGASGLFTASAQVSREEFQRYVTRLRLPEFYPGVQGLGFATRLRPAELAAFTAQQRQAGFSDFQPHPAGTRADYLVITYLEPLDRRNHAALGYDMFSEPIRQTAMKLSMQSGHAAASGKVTLVQEIDEQKQAGFLIYVPVYQGGGVPASEAERWEKLRGFAYSPFRADDLLNGLVGTQPPDICYEIFDGAPQPENLLHRSHPDANLAAGRLHTQNQLEIAGRSWTLAFATRPQFEQSSNRQLPLYVLLGGGLLSFLLFALVRAQIHAQVEAQAATRTATTVIQQSQQALSENEERYRTITETASDAILTIDENSVIVFANQATETMFGYPLQELLGQPLTKLMPAELRAAHLAGFERYLHSRQRRLPWDGVEVPGQHQDGHAITLEISFGEFLRKGQRFFTGVVRDISERKAVEKALAERTRLTALSAEIGAALTQSDDLAESLRLCAEALVRHLDVAFARIWTLNEAAQMLELRASAGLYTQLDGSYARIPVGQFNIGWIAAEARPHLTNDLLNDPRLGDPAWAERTDLHAFAGHPLIVDDKLVGVLALFAHQPLPETLLETLSASANSIALGIKRKQNEAELRQNEERLRAMVDSVPLLAWMAEPDGHIFWYNERWYQYTGTTPQQMEGWGWQSVHDPAMLPQVLERWRASIQQGTPFEMEFPLRGADGQFRWFLTRISPLRDEQGQVRRWFGTNTDVDELRKAREDLRLARDQSEIRVQERTRELAEVNAGLREQIRQRLLIEDVLQEKQEFLNALLDSLSAGIVACDAHGKLTLFNRATRELHGLPELPLPAEEWASHYDLYQPDGQTPMRKEDVPLFRALAGEIVRDVEMVIAPKHGLPRTLLANGRVILNQKNQKLGAVVAMNDITDRKAAEQALQALNQELTRSNRELQDFAFVASHDLQEPLRKIQAFGDLLLTQFGPQLGPEGEDFLQRMQKASQRMHTLINDLLAYSRVTTKAQPFALVDLNPIAAEVLEDLETRLRQTHGAVQLGALPTLQADPVQMRQLLQNLLANALKFHRPDVPPRIHIQAQPAEHNCTRLTVTDNGIGFEEKYLDRIFTPFQRLHSHGQYEGTGMGLAVCRKIVERHGGHITAQSRPGHGTTFIVTLPLQQAPGTRFATPALTNG